MDCLEARRFLRQEDAAAEPDRDAALEHLDGCVECSAIAPSLDPLLLFRRLPASRSARRTPRACARRWRSCAGRPADPAPPRAPRSACDWPPPSSPPAALWLAPGPLDRAPTGADPAPARAGRRRGPARVPALGRDHLRRLRRHPDHRGRPHPGHPRQRGRGGAVDPYKGCDGPQRPPSRGGPCPGVRRIGRGLGPDRRRRRPTSRSRCTSSPSSTSRPTTPWARSGRCSPSAARSSSSRAATPWSCAISRTSSRRSCARCATSTIRGARCGSSSSSCAPTACPFSPPQVSTGVSPALVVRLKQVLRYDTYDSLATTSFVVERGRAGGLRLRRRPRHGVPGGHRAPGHPARPQGLPHAAPRPVRRRRPAAASPSCTPTSCCAWARPWPWCSRATRPPTPRWWSRSPVTPPPASPGADGAVMEFLCRLGTPEGRVVEEIHESSDGASLRGALERRGFHVFSVERRGFSLAPRALAPRLPALRRPRRVKPRQFLVFNQELAALLKAGLPLLQSLDLMLERRTHPRLRAVLSEVRERVKTRRGPLRRVRPLRRPLPAALRGEPQGRRAIGRAREGDPPLHPLHEAGARGAPQGDLGAGLPGGADRALRR